MRKRMPRVLSRISLCMAVSTLTILCAGCITFLAAYTLVYCETSLKLSRLKHKLSSLERSDAHSSAGSLEFEIKTVEGRLNEMKNAKGAAFLYLWCLAAGASVLLSKLVNRGAETVRRTTAAEGIVLASLVIGHLYYLFFCFMVYTSTD
jgi:hypothetical protein